MKYFLIAGEASGDLHASHLMRALKECDPHAEFSYLGGDLMHAEGGELVRHYRDMAFMGFIEVIRHADKVMENFRLCKKALRAFCPDVLILIDYPSFNLKMARFAKEELHIPVHYYISPKIWAWKTYRIKEIKRYVDRLYSILPFEVSFYNQYGYKIDYVGNPTVDELFRAEESALPREEFLRKNQLPDKPIIALLAGSRRKEVISNLPTMLRVASSYPDYQLIVAGAPGLEASFYHSLIGEYSASVLFGQTHEILKQAQAALVTSGTATLEAGLLNVPQAVCYHVAGGPIVHAVLRKILKVKKVSLVNLIADEWVVRELVGELFKEELIRSELDRLLSDTSYRATIQQGYARVRDRLGDVGAPQRAAALIVTALK